VADQDTTVTTGDVSGEGDAFANLDSFEANAETGELEAKFSAPEPEAEAAAEDSPDLHDDGAVAEEADTYEKRYNDLRAEFDRRNASYTQAEKAVEENAKLRMLAGRLLQERRGGRAAGDDEENVDYLEAFSDPKKGRELLAAREARIIARVREEVRQELEQYRPALEDSAMSREVREAVIEHPDLFNYGPLMEQVYDMFPDQEITIKRAYLIAKKMASLAPGGASGKQPPVETPADPKPSRGQVSVSELRDRAALLETETGVGGVVGDRVKKPAQSRREAFDQAFEEMMNGV
jgi:hypothetical protein